MKQDLFLIIPANIPENRLLERFGQLCLKTPPQAVLYETANQPDKQARHVIEAIQARNSAVILKEDVAGALSLQADGVQIVYGSDIKKIRKQIGEMALGVLCVSRDEAMRAGEAGADYIGFDGENAAELTQWWSELFTLPCVDFNLDCPSDAADFQVQVLTG
ncbi:MAG: thiamine phosphate synthase [Alphaproteobacteria bacterium]|nr:thiamine phosphate synthase [Alphaproteobacteria bacterium]